MGMQQDILIEFRRIGAILVARALDCASLTEVTVQGPASAGEAALQRAALAKLSYVMKKKAGAR